jgi:arylsulfatase A-like enzyme
LNLARNLIQGAAGGLLGGSLLGLGEALYQASTAGAPDHLAPFYGWILYGLIGLGFGLVGGVLLTVVERFYRFGKGAEAMAFGAGAATAIGPMLAFILLYVVNKEVYAEAGIPMMGKLAILGTVGLAMVLELTVGVAMLNGPLGFLLKGPGILGTWGAVAAAGLGFSFVPAGDDPWAGLGGAPMDDALKSKPDILLIAVDTLRADHLGTYGKEGGISPVIDAIAADGVVFEQHIAQASWTRSSFASLWSSRIPSSHVTDKKASRMPDELVLLSEALQEAGVQTGNLANNINVTSSFNFDQGYDVFLYESPAYPFGASESVFGLTFYKVVHKLAEKFGPKVGIGKQVETFYQPAEKVLADAQRYIEGSADQRWFLGVHLMEPHDPYFEHPYLMGKGDAEFNGKGYARAEHESPDPKDAEYLKQVYVDEIRHMDKKLAPFIDWLKSTGRYDDLMIVLTADHGEEFNEHGGFWHGTTLYDEQIHIPLIVKLPKGELKGTRVAWQSRAIDVAPTIAAAVGAPKAEGWQGSDLLGDVRTAVQKAAEAEKAAAEREAKLAAVRAVLAATPDDAAALAELTTLEAAPVAPPALVHRFAVSEEDFEGNVVAAARDGQHKLITAAPGGPRGLREQELFDIVADPGETKPLTDAAKATDLADKLKAVVSGAEAGAAKSNEATISEADREALCALGYLDPETCNKK